jgi:hypothetical protein
MAISKINSKSIEDGIISADDLAAGSISTAKIANSAVTAAKINDGDISTAKIADSAVTAAKITDGAVTNSKITGNVNFKNIIINGDMSIAQRGTSSAGITATGYYTVDRWNVLYTNLGTWTQSQDSDVPSGQGFTTSLKMDCTTSATPYPATNSRVIIRQLIEGQMLQYIKKGTANAESLSLSFWIKSNKTGTYTSEIFDADNTRQISKTFTINVADTWEKKTIIYAGDTTGTLNNDNTDGLTLFLYFGAGTTFTSGTFNTSWNTAVTENRVSPSQVNLADSTSNYINITGVQLEAGTTASDFEFLPFDTQLQRCLRYYEKSVNYSVVPAENADNPTTGGVNGWIAFDPNNIRTPPISFKCEKRASPTITLYRGGNSTDGNMAWFNGSSWQNAGTSVPKITTKGFYGTYNSGGSFTQFNAYLMEFSWTADSEF